MATRNPSRMYMGVGVLVVLSIASRAYGGADDGLTCITDFAALPPHVSVAERCGALARFTECVKLASSNMQVSEARKYENIVIAAQGAALGDCTAAATYTPIEPRFTTIDENLRVTVGEAKDIRFRRVSDVQEVSIFDLMTDVTALKKDTVNTSDLQSRFEAMWEAQTPPLASMTAVLSTLHTQTSTALSKKVDDTETLYRTRFDTFSSSNTKTVNAMGLKVDTTKLDLTQAMAELKIEINKNVSESVAAIAAGLELVKAGGAIVHPKSQSLVTDTVCTTTAAGTMRFNTVSRQMEYCDGVKFIAMATSIPIYTDSKGYTQLGSAFNPATSCLAIKAASTAAPSGTYYLKLGTTVKPHYCRMDFDNGGWTMLMKVAPGDTFAYDASYWETDNTLNDDRATQSMDGDSKFEAFNKMPIKELLLVTKHGAVQLKITTNTNKPLRSLMGYGQTQFLTYVRGPDRPERLFRTPTFRFTGGSDYANPCGPVYRIEGNSKSTGLRIRIGGHFDRVWGCNYGVDHRGAPCAAEGAGFGVRDSSWGPFEYARKSAGIRHAHDTYPSDQVPVEGIIYAR